MVERKLKGVLVVLSILIVVMFSGLISADYCAGTAYCEDFSDSYSCEIGSIDCAWDSGAGCINIGSGGNICGSAWDEFSCQDIPGCSWYVETPTQCTYISQSATPCCTGEGSYKDSNWACGVYDTMYRCDGNTIYSWEEWQYCTYGETACNGAIIDARTTPLYLEDEQSCPYGCSFSGELTYNPGCDTSCPPQTCNGLGIDCGSVSDGCSGTLWCGDCGIGETCSNNQCISFCGGTDTSCGTSGSCQNCNNLDGYYGGEYCVFGSPDTVNQEYRNYYCSVNSCTYTSSSDEIDNCYNLNSCNIGGCVDLGYTAFCDWTNIRTAANTYDDCCGTSLCKKYTCDNTVYSTTSCPANTVCEDSSGTPQCEASFECNDDYLHSSEVCDDVYGNLEFQSYSTNARCSEWDWHYESGYLGCNSCTSINYNDCTACGDGTLDSSRETCDGGGTSCTSLGEGYDCGWANCQSDCSGYSETNCDWDVCYVGQRECSGGNARVCIDGGSGCNYWEYDYCSDECSGGYCVECTDSGDCWGGTACQDATCNSGNCGLENRANCCIDNSYCNDWDGCTNDICSGAGGTCSNPSACDSASESCISDSCVECDLWGASWNPSSNLEDGDYVTLSVSGNSACNGKDIRFVVRRDPLFSSATSIAWPGSDTFSSGASRGWTISISEEGAHDFYAYVDGASSIRDYSSNVDINFAPPPVTCPDGDCNNGETCSTCPADCGCGAQTCVSGSCVWPCSIDSASWSSTSATSGDWRALDITTSDCDGKAVTFEVWERDPFGDDQMSSPSSQTVSGNSAQAWWQAIAPQGSETEPEYYFIATIEGETRESANDLNVIPLAECGDGDLDSGEECDDGANNGNICTPSYGSTCDWCDSGCNDRTETGDYCGDGDCDAGNEDSSSCLVDCPIGVVCGNGVLETGEECDDGDTSSGDGCDSNCDLETGWKCPTPGSPCDPACGDGELDAGEECDDGNTVSGDCCDATCHNEACGGGTCDVFNAYWTQISVQEGTQVDLNVETTDCDDGEIVVFTVMEDDTLPGDDNVINNPSNTVTSGNLAHGTWLAEWQQDTEIGEDSDNTPEYYFRVEVQGFVGSLEISNNFLRVLENSAWECVSINDCSAYTTQGECETDSCTVAEASLPGTTCGFEFDPDTRCYFGNDCGCQWEAGVCGPYYNDEMSCEECGNFVEDFGEECDDGNQESNDGCSYPECELEIGSPPCGEGMTLCSDNTCSINCDYTDAGPAVCNYDTICQDGVEGCTCSDCDNRQDTCEGGFLCSINDGACCNAFSDGICHPYCAYVDPDCAGNDYCGNGFRGFQEECDDNGVPPVNGDGCSITCEYEVIGPGVPCLEGMMICSDGTCSLNCDATDEGPGDCSGGSCCAAGLSYYLLDNACCNGNIDGTCNPYCALSDPDCNSGIFASIDGIGACSYTKNSADDCDDGVLKRDYTASWTWDPTNEFYASPGSDDYVEDPIGIWHYDPRDLTGFRRSERCTDISDELICPAQIQLPGFGKMQLIAAIALIAIVYTIIVFRRRD
jgi:cysteine-rich repeat protein